ncbi:hypothetical protein THAOC_09890 [Thalassiosira oceanica]|uniref:Uncharacterized protein n=1 Tax=Thalassiosira oceanica TaxID=159749 RepID=K0SU04_THAOC|nr:hypothetical protein THAOC_09890 [Thalassiosira oceanica]|eukprot:EJK68900.1 hypothetical protein THAOC_09890 [Thalassiosira oceanica]
MQIAYTLAPMHLSAFYIPRGSGKTTWEPTSSSTSIATPCFRAEILGSDAMGVGAALSPGHSPCEHFQQGSACGLSGCRHLPGEWKASNTNQHLSKAEIKALVTKEAEKLVSQIKAASEAAGAAKASVGKVTNKLNSVITEIVDCGGPVSGVVGMAAVALGLPGPRARNHRRNIRRRMKRKAARLSRHQVGTSGEDNAQNFARSASKPQESHGPRARNHRRNIHRRNKRKAARMSSQAQKKTYSMSSGRADNVVQLFTKKASKSSGMEIYHAGYTALPEEKVNTNFRDEQHNCRANFARKKTHVTSSGEAGNQDKLHKKKVDKPSGMETY